LLAVGEYLGLRGGEIDKVNAEALKAARDETLAGALAAIKPMTLTVIDGDFPRKVIADQNLAFSAYRMPQRRNVPTSYDAKLKGPAAEPVGVLMLGSVPRRAVSGNEHPEWWFGLFAGLALIAAAAYRRRAVMNPAKSGNQNEES